jgi:hypothetical protein
MQMLGKRAPRLDKRTLKFSDYRQVVPPLPEPPLRCNWLNDIPEWPMDLNDQLGDCVIAAMAHMIQQWTFNVKAKLGVGEVIIPTEGEVLAAYEVVGGYNPADPSTDQGCDMLTALKYWKNTGLAGHKIAAFISINPNDQQEWKDAIALFGNIFTGFALPLSAQGQSFWTVPPEGLFQDGSPGSWGGHCVPCGNYFPNAADPTHEDLTCVTWGQTLNLSRNFLTSYCDEAYAVLSPDFFSVVNGDLVAPNKFDLAQLQADLTALQNREHPKS